MRLNLAARAGRWSASHWKTATFGWIAFVDRRRRARRRGRHEAARRRRRPPGESGRMAKILDEGFDAGRGDRAGPERDAHRDSPAFAAAVEDVVSPVSAIPAVTNVREPARAGQRRSDLGRRPARRSSASTSAAIPTTRSDKIDPVVAAVDEAKAAHPELFIGSFGEATADKEIDESGRRRSRAGRPALAAGHDRGPDRRVRRARRRGHPAAARAHGRDRDDGAARAAEPGLAGGRQRRAPSCC